MKLSLPDLTHQWKLVAFDDLWFWECAACLSRWRGVPANQICPDAVLAWGRQMREAGAEVERSAIVRHLIDRAEDVRSSPAVMDFTNQLATEIESLEHNKEG